MARDAPAPSSVDPHRHEDAGTATLDQQGEAVAGALQQGAEFRAAGDRLVVDGEDDVAALQAGACRRAFDPFDHQAAAQALFAR
ncbi:hypothetical protein RZS08_09915, partial [Arthrospira platensis SPKY1]|nr:hypothetical protein [Arthrospira platensis SPKY1]